MTSTTIQRMATEHTDTHTKIEIGAIVVRVSLSAEGTDRPWRYDVYENTHKVGADARVIAHSWEPTREFAVASALSALAFS